MFAGILSRVCDTNTRIKDVATEAILHLATVPAVGLAQATGLLTKCALRTRHGVRQMRLHILISTACHPLWLLQHGLLYADLP